MYCMQAPDFLLAETHLRLIPITTFHGMAQLFKDQEEMKEYEENSGLLNALVSGMESNALFALVCLFSTKDTMMLENRGGIQAMQVNVILILYYVNWNHVLNDCPIVFQDHLFKVSKFAHERFKHTEPETLRNMLKLCERMAANFKNGVTWDRNDLYQVDTCLRGPPGGVITLDFLVKTFLESYDAFPFGAELMKEVVMFRLGVPFSRRFLGRFWMVTVDRCRFLLRQVGAAAQASYAAQVSLSGEQDKTNLPLHTVQSKIEFDIAEKMCKEEEDMRILRLAALYMMKLNTCPDVMTQVFAGTGEFDIKNINKRMALMLNAATTASEETCTLHHYAHLHYVTQDMLARVDSAEEMLYP